MVQLMPLHPKTPSLVFFFKSRPVLPFWHWHTPGCPGKEAVTGVIEVYYQLYKMGNWPFKLDKSHRLND